MVMRPMTLGLRKQSQNDHQKSEANQFYIASSKVATDIARPHLKMKQTQTKKMILKRSDPVPSVSHPVR